MDFEDLLLTKLIFDVYVDKHKIYCVFFFFTFFYPKYIHLYKDTVIHIVYRI